MSYDKKMFRWLGLLIFVPVILAFLGGDRFRYPCQDPANWGTEACIKPACEIHRQCPEHIFDRDPEMQEIITRNSPNKGPSK